MSSLKQKSPLTEKWVSKEGIHFECGLPCQARISLFGESVDFAHGWPNFKLVVELRHILRYDSLSTYCLIITCNSRVSFPDSWDRNEVMKLVIFIKKTLHIVSHWAWSDGPRDDHWFVSCNSDLYSHCTSLLMLL